MDFLDEPGTEVRLGSLVDAPVEFGARRVEGEDAQARGLRRRGGTPRALGRERDARLQSHLDGALHARPVARLKACCRFGVEPAQNFVEMLNAPALAYACEATAQAFVRRRRFKKRLSKRAQVEARAADEQSGVAARLYLVNLPKRVARPVGGGVVHFGRDEVNQMVRHAAPPRGRNFRGGDFYLPVDLHGVAVDDLAVEPQGERDSELALARSRRADDGDDRPRCLRLGAHAEGKTRRKSINSQMTASSASAPTSCLREKCIVRSASQSVGKLDSTRTKFMKQQ